MPCPRICHGAIRTIQADNLAPRTLVVLEDDLSTRANFRHVFGALLPEASALLFDNQVSLWIEPPPPEIDPAAKPTGAARIATFRLIDGRVEPGALTSSVLGTSPAQPGLSHQLLDGRH